MITAQQVNKARLELKLLEQYHEHDDSVRIAYEWLDSQTITKFLTGEQGAKGEKFNLKRLVSDWGGREIMQSDIAIAAYLHPEIKGDYPFYNISPQLIFPSAERLRGIGESFRHGFEEQYMIKNYRFYEIVKYTSDDGHSIVRSFYSEKLPESQNDQHDFCTQNDNCQCYYCVYGR